MRKKNAAHSIRDRLLKLSRESGEDFQQLLTRYAVERFLFRLSQSEHQRELVLKGAMLFALWTGKMHRPTRDLDLLGFRDSDAGRRTGVLKAVCAVDVRDDGSLTQRLLRSPPSATTMSTAASERR
jgi:hypothetical protein